MALKAVAMPKQTEASTRRDRLALPVLFEAVRRVEQSMTGETIARPRRVAKAKKGSGVGVTRVEGEGERMESRDATRAVEDGRSGNRIL